MAKWPSYLPGWVDDLHVKMGAPLDPKPVTVASRFGAPSALTAPEPRDLTAYQGTRNALLPTRKYGVFGTLMDAYATLHYLPEANAAFDARGLGGGVGYDRAQQVQGIADLQAALDRFQTAFRAGSIPPVETGRLATYQTLFTDWGLGIDRIGTDWGETKDVAAYTVWLRSYYPYHTGEERGMWREIAIGSAVVGVATVGMVAGGALAGALAPGVTGAAGAAGEAGAIGAVGAEVAVAVPAAAIPAASIGLTEIVETGLTLGAGGLGIYQGVVKKDPGEIIKASTLIAGETGMNPLSLDLGGYLDGDTSTPGGQQLLTSLVGSYLGTRSPAATAPPPAPAPAPGKTNWLLWGGIGLAVVGVGLFMVTR